MYEPKSLLMKIWNHADKWNPSIISKICKRQAIRHILELSNFMEMEQFVNTIKTLKCHNFEFIVNNTTRIHTPSHEYFKCDALLSVLREKAF